MRQVLLVKFGEVHLKGQNRPYFLKILVGNLKNAVAKVGGKVWLNDSRIFVRDMTDMEECIKCATRVFGVHSVSPAVEMDKDFDSVCNQAIEMMRDIKGSFKVDARRSDKRYPLNSMEICIEAGARIMEGLSEGQLTVDVHKPEYRMNIEIRDLAYLYVRSIPAVGGMPMGTGGKAGLLLSGGIDSPVAGWMIMKRGVNVEGIHFFSFPYTSERAKEKVLELARIMATYSGSMKVHVVPFTKIQMEIHEKCPDELGTLLMRRFMMKISECIAKKRGLQALITGESIGQVASQTMEALNCTDEVVNMPIFRPVIGMDKSDITDIAIRIGTFETSTLPYEDCCTVFTPRHPATKPKMDRIYAAEALLESESLIDEAVMGTELFSV